MMLLTISVLAWLAETTDSFNTICYFTKSSLYNVRNHTLLPEDIDPNLCTHINYAFANYVGVHLLPIEANDEDIFQRLVKLKQINPRLKVLLAVGGDTTTSVPILQQIQNSEDRQTLVKNTVNYLRTRQFDGFNVDYNYFAKDGSAAIDKHKFTLLIEELWQAFTKDAETTGTPRLLLGIAVSASKDIIDNAYEVEQLTNIVDFMNIISYDYHGNWEEVVGFNSPLYANTDEQGAARYQNVNWTANYYVSLGAIKSKLHIGIPTYGRSFTLRSPSYHSILSPATIPENVSESTRQEGVKPYYEVCGIIYSGGTVVLVPSQVSSYVVKDNQWIGYDDPKSVSEKACYANSQGFGGVTVWSLNFDDFRGKSCYQGKMPLLSAIYSSQDKQETRCTSDIDGAVGRQNNKSGSTLTDTQQASHNISSGFRIYCYYTNWAQYRALKGKFLPENIDPHLCTHISYAIAKPIDLKIEPSEWNDEEMYSRVIKIKESNPDVKVLLAIGGYTMESELFNPIIESEYSRTHFAKNAVDFLRQRQFDGLDVGWENTTNKRNFQRLMEEIKRAFDEDSSITFMPRLLLVATVAAEKEKIDSSYDIPHLVMCTDFINVMTYDYHGSDESFIGFNAPLYANPKETGEARFLNINWTMQYYVSLGAPKDKLNIGISSYGRSFTLINMFQHDVLSPSTGPGSAGPITRMKGLMSYYEICDFLNIGGESVYFKEQANPYAVKNMFWIGYDNVQSVTEKACYANTNGYGGLTFWSLDYDDFLGISCNRGQYPLLHAIHSAGKTRFGCSQTSTRSTSSGTDSYTYASPVGRFLMSEVILLWLVLTTSL